MDLTPILSAFDDDGPRLVLADRLTEAGDPRGEFIVLECALNAQDGLSRLRQERRRDALYELHGDAWRKGLKPPSVHWHARRGIFDWVIAAPAAFAKGAKAIFESSPAARFIELIEPMQPALWPKIAALKELARVKELKIRDSIGDGSLAALLASRHLGELVALDPGPELGDGDARALARAPLRSLRRLSLEDCSLGESGMRALLDGPLVKQLEELRLRDCDLDDAAIKELTKLKALPNLRVLDLSENDIHEEGAKLLARLDLPALRTLNVSGNELGDAGGAALAAADYVTGLEHLGLHDLHADVAPFAALARRELPRLVTLDAGGHQSADEKGIAALAKGSYPCLRTLLLASTVRSAKAVRALAAARGMGALVRLDLRRNRHEGSGFGDDGAKALAGTKTLSSLSQLALEGQHIGADGAIALGEAKGFAPLTHLDLRDNTIGPRGAQALFASPKLAALEFLDLDHNEIGPKGVKALTAMKTTPPLIELNLRANVIGDEGAKALAAWEGLATIEVLALQQNRIKADGAKALGASPHTTNLCYLDISDNKFGDAGAMAIAKCKAPRLRVSLDGSGTTAKGQAAVKKRWPNERRF